MCFGAGSVTILSEQKPPWPTSLFNCIEGLQPCAPKSLESPISPPLNHFLEMQCFFFICILLSNLCSVQEWHDYVDGLIILHDVILQEAAKNPTNWARLRLAAGLFPMDFIDDLDKMKPTFTSKNIVMQMMDVKGPPGSNIPFKSIKQIELLPKTAADGDIVTYWPIGMSVVEKPKGPNRGGGKDQPWREYLQVISSDDFEPKQVLQFLMTNSGSRAMMYILAHYIFFSTKNVNDLYLVSRFA